MNDEEYLALIHEHPELSGEFIYHAPSRTQSGYWRLKPQANNKRGMLALAESSYNAYGTKGFVMQKDGILPVVAAINRKNLKGKELAPKLSPYEKIRRLLEMRKRLEVIPQT